MIKNNPPKTVEIPTAYLERLEFYIKNVDEAEGDELKYQALPSLLGYLEGLLKIHLKE